MERFGERVVARPEPQAIWRKGLSDEEWARLAEATFQRSARGDSALGGKVGEKIGEKFGGKGGDKGAGGSIQSDERGLWMVWPGLPDRWTMVYENSGLRMRMRLALTGFKHVGVFPEQAANWDFIYENVRKILAGGAADTLADSKNGAGGAPKVLNLFAYTGCATLAARAAGAEVTHVDSVKQTVSWAADNQELSGLGGVRWIVDDALKFVRRDVRRGALYDGIVLDPPAYGRGPDGEKWVLETNIDEMLEACAKLLKPNGFFVLNLYSMGLSALLARTAVHRHFGGIAAEDEQFGELYFTDRAGKDLPLGVYYRFVR